MKQIKLSILLLTFFGIGQLNAKSVERQQFAAFNQSEDYHKRAEAELKRDRGQALVIKVLDSIVTASQKMLRSKGKNLSAVSISREWKIVRSAYVDPFARDIGDHKPMSDFLTKWYDRLEKIFGKTVLRLTRIDDLKLFNYAIPVVYHPAGHKGESWNKAEYRLHFVGYAGALTYWGSLLSCRVAVEFPLGLFCGPAALVARKQMEKNIAPKMSDRVYDRYN